MSMLEGFRAHLEIFGIRGVLAISSNRLFHLPREIIATPPGSKKPVHLRLHTTDASTYRENLLSHEYGFDLPFSPRVIVDAGANIGMASVYFANRYPQARIFSLEAEADNFRMLQKNVRPYPQIISLHAAVWTSNGEVQIFPPNRVGGSRGNWGFTVARGSGTPAITMSTLIRRFGLETIDVLKIDIEGAEKELFSAPHDWLRRVRCVMIETHDRFKPGCSQTVVEALGVPAIRRGEKDLHYLS